MDGLAIPAHPLALRADRKLDERRQRGLTRYYLAAGAGGIAVGVHTTQFEIHQPQVGLYQPVLELAVTEVEALVSEEDAPLKVAGIVGKTESALREATVAHDLGYDCGLLSLGAMGGVPNGELIEHAQAVSEVIPLFGFYLQPAVGGRVLDFDFWCRFAEIDHVVAIKIAPFNRYQTLDVVRAVVAAGRAREIALYTGNDDHILLDLLAPLAFFEGGERHQLRMVGGLLGQWAAWTLRAVELVFIAGSIARKEDKIPPELLTLNAEITDANAAIFDAANGFSGCIPGIHEVLRRQGLLEGRWCLDPELDLSAGQMEEIDRVCSDYPHLNDDEFVRQHLDEWLSG